MRQTEKKARIVHPHAWVWEGLEQEPGFVLRSMFGAKAVYLDGKMVLCCSSGEEPWNGVLVCTGREHHAALQAEFPALVEHPILGKWLYLSEENAQFERLAGRLARLVKGRDPRIGIVPKPKRPRKAKGSWLSG